jgi:uncharacterized protein
MAHFLIEYADLGDAQGRDRYRSDHIAYRKGLGEAMPLAGPLLDSEGKPDGSVVILEAESEAEAEATANADPYVIHGVVDLISVRRYRIAAMKPPVAG